MMVENLMSMTVYTCAVSDTLDVPARIMWERDVGVVPVVDVERALVGILTDRDIAMAAMLQGKPLQRIGVSEIMSREVATVAPKDDLHAAEAVMAGRQVRRVPVVDGAKHVVGLLSLNDLASAATDGQAAGVPAADLARTMAAVGRPRGSSPRTERPGRSVRIHSAERAIPHAAVADRDHPSR